MNMSRIIALAIFLTVAPVCFVRAQTDPGPVGGGQTQELVDQLKELIRGAEQDRRSNPAITNHQAAPRSGAPLRLAVESFASLQ